MRKIPEQDTCMIKVRVYILWENARVYNREGNNHGAEVKISRTESLEPDKQEPIVRKVGVWSFQEQGDNGISKISRDIED